MELYANNWLRGVAGCGLWLFARLLEIIGGPERCSGWNLRLWLSAALDRAVRREVGFSSYAASDTWATNFCEPAFLDFHLMCFGGRPHMSKWA